VSARVSDDREQFLGRCRHLDGPADPTRSRVDDRNRHGTSFGDAAVTISRHFLTVMDFLPTRDRSVVKNGDGAPDPVDALVRARSNVGGP
jgi:hypothetical protein